MTDLDQAYAPFAITQDVVWAVFPRTPSWVANRPADPVFVLAEPGIQGLEQILTRSTGPVAQALSFSELGPIRKVVAGPPTLRTPEFPFSKRLHQDYLFLGRRGGAAPEAIKISAPSHAAASVALRAKYPGKAFVLSENLSNLFRWLPVMADIVTKQEVAQVAADFRDF